MVVNYSLNFHWDNVYWQKLITAVKGEPAKIKKMYVPQVTSAEEQDEQKYGHRFFFKTTASMHMLCYRSYNELPAPGFLWRREETTATILQTKK